MKKVMIISLIIAVILVGLSYWFILSPILSNENDMKNTEHIYVIDNNTGESWSITDDAYINKLVKQAQTKEYENTYDTSTWQVNYVLEFYTPKYGYGPLECYKEKNVCIYSSASNKYIKVKKEFFEVIEKTKP